MIKAILFDFDGTLADTAPGIVNTLSATLKRMDVTVPSDEAMRQTTGLYHRRFKHILSVLS